MAKTLRRFSMAGPCITLGEIVRETAQFYVVQKRVCGYEEGGELVTRKFKKDGEQIVHSSPCVSCRDHTETQYPRGYED